MDSFPIRQQDNTEVAAFVFVNFCPAADSTVSLNVLPLWRFDDVLNPFVLDYRTVWPGSNRLEIFCSFHCV